MLNSVVISRYHEGMNEIADDKRITVRVVGKDHELAGDSWKNSPPSERIDAVWLLTKLCMAWNNDDGYEPRLQRSVTRLKRRTR